MKSTPADGTETGLVAELVRSSVVDGPGHRFAVFLQGCNFDCIACHNPQTIPGHAKLDGHHPQRMRVSDVVDEIRTAAPFIRGVTVSGGEATQQPRFVSALFDVIKGDPALDHLTCLVDSNGACDLAVWDGLAPRMDGAMIDLKCIDPTIHRRMTGHDNDMVLASIVHLDRLDLLTEVRLLVVAGTNDDPELIERTGAWLASVDQTMPVTLIGFRSTGTRPHDPPLGEPSQDQMHTLAAALAKIAPFELRVV